MDTPIKPSSKHLKDYTPPDFLVDTVALIFDLEPGATHVYARLTVRKNPEKSHTTPPPLRLDGQALALLSIALDDKPLPASRFSVEATQLVIFHVPDLFVLTLQTRIYPAANTSLEGLYESGELLCTQCEAEGFRKIIYYPDRPDIMARFTTTLIADKKQFPILLANGNRKTGIDDAWHNETCQHILESAPSGKHTAIWEDPYPKPCYLFALVAGKLVCQRDLFITCSGRRVDLEIYVESEHDDTVEPATQKCLYAMTALKKAMAWDEEHFGREYDLETYMIVAVNDFNMGAMENKGLNIFNAKYVLADQDTATDQDFKNIEGIIAHEYFHNWTGNRITCRDWFQLSLKEGLTVFRDQAFSAQTTSPAVQRIEDARLIRTQQFAEDCGPMAHPVQPASYIEINNFYTLTIYNKGAEVVRMIHTLLGTNHFRQGMDLYFQRHDGQAVTVEAFIQAMEAASGRDLRQFRRWYHQAGTPVLTITTHHDAQEQTLHMRVQQTCPATPGQASKKPFHIPLMVGLLDASAKALPLVLLDEALPGERKTEKPQPISRLLELRQAEENFIFTGIPQKPIPSLLRHFSAPVILHANLCNTEHAFLWANDPDPFNRWSAGQTLAIDVLLRLAADSQANRPLLLEETFVESFASVLQTKALDPATTALLLTLPTETSLLELMEQADPQAIHTASQFLRKTLANRLHETLRQKYIAYTEPKTTLATPMTTYNPVIAGRRALKNLCLDLLVTLQWPELWQLALRQFEDMNNMTDRMAALAALLYSASPDAEHALAAFAQQWKKDSLVMDKWFALQAKIPEASTLQRVRLLQKHRLFSLKNPNRVRALLGSFCHGNPLSFHQPSGKGYPFLVEQVLALDPVNPQGAARLASALTHWKKLEPKRKEKMRAALQTLYHTAGLSRDVFEIVSKSLETHSLA